MPSARAGFLRLDGHGPPHGEAIHRQHDDRAGNCHDESDGIALAVPADQTAHEPTDQGARDSQDRGDDEAPRIAPWHEELGDDADDQTEQDPSDDVHDALLSRPLAALNAFSPRSVLCYSFSPEAIFGSPT